ncbi:MAG: type II secretion system minor pseudopilin GspH [Steroidobacteraceae bacterium]
MYLSLPNADPLLPDRARCTKAQSGFTLIELLVVIVIIGIILTMATLSVGVLGRDTEVEDQARRLYAILTQAREEAELQGRDLGLLIESDGYSFMRYRHDLGQWQSLDNDEAFAYRKLPEGLQFHLWLDAREVTLKSHHDNQALLASASSSSSSASSMAIGPVGNSMDAAVRPQIAILSSGDILPFELQLARAGSDFSWRLLGGADNSLNIESGGSSR